MIKRYYFMTYKTAMVSGNSQEGHRARAFVSLLPMPIQALRQITASVESTIGQPVMVTSFYRVR